MTGSDVPSQFVGFLCLKAAKMKMKHNNGGQYKEMRILNSILRSNALLRSALERSWGFLRGSSIRASLQQQRNKRAILVKVILANLKAHKFLTNFSIKNLLDLSRRQFDFYFQKKMFSGKLWFQDFLGNKGQFSADTKLVQEFV